jgi:hypothetical protein
MSAVFDFKSIRRSVERLEQKADFEEKNPKPTPNPIVWTPEWGYGTGTNCEDSKRACGPSFSSVITIDNAERFRQWVASANCSVKSKDDARLQLYQMYGLGYQGEDEAGC